VTDGRLLVTGSSGHLGEALVRCLSAEGRDVIGLDMVPAPSTSVVGSVTDRELVRHCLRDVHAVIHAATLHKPHLASHTRAAFIETNVTGTLTLLEESVAAGVDRFVFTSSTSAFGRSLGSGHGEAAVWINEGVVPLPRNVYGVTKIAAENLCEVISLDHALPVVVLRVSRFFPEGDDNDDVRHRYPDGNVKANEMLYRRVDLQDAVDAHRCALARAPEIGFGTYIISAATPFVPTDADELGRDAPGVVRRVFPDYEAEYSLRGWSMFPRVDRVYDSSRARSELGWSPRYDFRHIVDLLKSGQDPRSPLAAAIGVKGYHPTPTGIYTT
jgi:UDP-glucose 4-epimerase